MENKNPAEKKDLEKEEELEKEKHVDLYKKHESVLNPFAQVALEDIYKTLGGKKSEN